MTDYEQCQQFCNQMGIVYSVGLFPAYGLGAYLPIAMRAQAVRYLRIDIGDLWLIFTADEYLIGEYASPGGWLARQNVAGPGFSADGEVKTGAQARIYVLSDYTRMKETFDACHVGYVEMLNFNANGRYSERTAIPPYAIHCLETHYQGFWFDVNFCYVGISHQYDDDAIVEWMGEGGKE